MPEHLVKDFTGKQLEVKASGYVSEKVQLDSTVPTTYNAVVTKVGDKYRLFDPEDMREIEEEEITFTDGVAELAEKVANVGALTITSNEYEETVERENNTCTELSLSDYRWCTDSQVDEWKAAKIVSVTSVKIDDVDIPTTDYYIGVGEGFNRFLFVTASKYASYSGKTAIAVVRREGAAEDVTLTLKNLSNSLWVMAVTNAGSPEMLQCINRNRSNREERIWLPNGTSIGPENRAGDGFFDGSKILAIPGGDIASNHGDAFYLKFSVSEESRELDPDEYFLDDDDRKTITLAEGVEVPNGAVADYLTGDTCDDIAICKYSDGSAGLDKIYTKGLFYKSSIDNWSGFLSGVQEDIKVK